MSLDRKPVQLMQNWQDIFPLSSSVRSRITILYGPAACTHLADMRRLQSFHMRCQRQIGGVKQYNCVKNIDTAATVGLPSIDEIICKRQNALFGHVVRLDIHTPAYQALNCVIRTESGHRPDVYWCRAPGHPRNTWIQQIG